MKYLRIIPLLVLASFMSCLLNTPQPKEKIRAAGFGEVRPGGDLDIRIKASLKALEGLIGDPAALFIPDSGDCPSRRAGEALLGAVLLSRASGAGTARADKIYEALHAGLNPSGYLGGVAPGVADESCFTGHGIILRGLCEYYLWTGQSTALEIAATICDSLFAPLTEKISSYPLNISDRVVPDTVDGQPVLTNGWKLSYGESGNIFAAMDGLAQFYSLRKNENCREALDELVSLYRKAVREPEGVASAPYLWGLKGLLRYGEARGDNEYHNEAEDAWDVFRKSSVNDFFGVAPVIGDVAFASCPEAVSEAYIIAMWLWGATGKGDYLEDAEKIFYNALAPSQTARGNFTGIYAASHLEKLSRCHGDTCDCVPMWAEAFVQAPRYSYFMRDNKILIPFFSTGELVLEQKGVRVVQTTDYPLGNSIRLEVAEAPKRGIGFQIHFPSYMNMKSMVLNGSTTIGGTVNSIGLLEFRDIFRKGDVIDINYSFGTKWSKLDEEGEDYKDMFKAVSGPLVLGYRADTLLWLERGVVLEESTENVFNIDKGFSYRRDTLTGMVDVLAAMAVEDVSGTETYEPPLFHPLYVPLEAYGREDILPEYILTRIGRE